jgi:hypothetical protein
LDTVYFLTVYSNVFDRYNGCKYVQRKGGHLARQSKKPLLRIYFLQNPSLPFVTTTQFASFSKPLMPVSEPEAGLIVSVLPLRENSIASPFAVPSYVFGPSRLAISITNLSAFFVTFRYAPSAPVQRPKSDSTLPAPTFATGLGDTAGDETGLAVAAGLGDAGGFISGVLLQAEAVASIAVRIIQIPKSKIPNRDGLLILLIFIFSGQSHLFNEGLTGRKPAVLSAEAACNSAPQLNSSNS